MQNASVNKISSIGTGSPNLLLFSLADGSATEPAVIPVAIAPRPPLRARAAAELAGQGDHSCFQHQQYRARANATVTGTFTPGERQLRDGHDRQMHADERANQHKRRPDLFQRHRRDRCHMSYSPSSTPTVPVITKP